MLTGEEMMPQDLQNGAVAALHARGDKKDQGKTVSKTPKAQGKDMVYYTQKLNGMAGPQSDEELDTTPDIFHMQQTGGPSKQTQQHASEQLPPDIATGEDGEDIEQPTLAEILRAVQKCTA